MGTWIHMKKECLKLRFLRWEDMSEKHVGIFKHLRCFKVMSFFLILAFSFQSTQR